MVIIKDHHCPSAEHPQELQEAQSLGIRPPLSPDRVLFTAILPVRSSVNNGTKVPCRRPSLRAAKLGGGGTYASATSFKRRWYSEIPPGALCIRTAYLKDKGSRGVINRGNIPVDYQFEEPPGCRAIVRNTRFSSLKFL